MSGAVAALALALLMLGVVPSRAIAALAVVTDVAATGTGDVTATGTSGVDAAGSSGDADKLDAEGDADSPAARSALRSVVARGSFCSRLPEWRAFFQTSGNPKAGAAATAGAASPSRSGGTTQPELILDATVNGSPMAAPVRAVCLPSGRLGLSGEDWEALQLRPTRPIMLPEGRKVYALESVAGATYAVDTLAQSVAITAPAAAFKGVDIDGRPELERSPPRPPVGGYVTYDASVSFSRSAPSYGTTLNGTVFGPWGMFFGGGTLTGGPAGVHVVRGDTYWQSPSVEDMTTLTIGDTVGVGGAWSRPVRFFGISYARDFTTRPGFLTFPMPSVSGSAALPSTVSVLINNEQRLTSQVPAGPFNITNVPVVTGAGEMHLVVTDPLGRQSVITQSYYVSARMLAPGITDFAYEAGFERLDYGSRSFDYGRPVADATYRWGATRWLTAEVRGEAETDRGALGVGLWSTVGDVGTLNAAAAYSVSRGENGGNYLAGFQSTGRTLGYSVVWQYFERGYRPFAESPGEIRPREQITAGGGVQAGRLGSLTASFVYQSQWGQPTNEFISAGWSRDIVRGVSMMLSGNKNLIGGGWSASVGIGFTFGPHLSVSNTATTTNTGTTAYTTVSSPMPSGPGVGWSVRADYEAESLDASVLYNIANARLTGDLAVSRSSAAARLGASGSVGMLSGYGFVAPPITSSFAIVRAAGVPGAPVMLWNQLAAVTGPNGVALIPNLGAYQSSKISIDPNTLPMDVEVNGDTVFARPWPRAGVFIDLPVRRTRSALVVLRQTGGEPVPLGATVTLQAGGAGARVAEDGEVWLTDLANDNHLTVTWGADGCEARLALPKPFSPGDKLGPIVCAPVGSK